MNARIGFNASTWAADASNLRFARFTPLALAPFVVGAVALAQPPSGWGGAPAVTELHDRMVEELHVAETRAADKARLEAELNGLSEARTTAGDRVRHRVRALYRLSRAGALPAASGLDGMLTHLGRLEHLERMVRNDVDDLAELNGRIAALQTERGLASHEVKQSSDRLNRLRAQQEALQQAPVATIQRQANAYHLPTGSMVVHDAPNSTPAFARLRGALTTPVGATAEVRTAQREDGQGVEFVAAAGTAVRAAANGRVVFSDVEADYGRLVILDHDNDYFTVYAGLGRVDVMIGDNVSSGARVGTLGADSDRPALFFQVRRGTRTLDTRRWLGI